MTGYVTSAVRNLQALLSHPLVENRPIATLMRVAQWQAVSRLNREVVFDWIEGQKLVCRRGMHGATGNIYVGLHELDDMAFVLHFLRPGDVFIDAGANIGSYTVLASGVCKARTHAFEPVEATLADLRRNIAVNRLDDLVTVHDCALGEIDGETRFMTGLGPTNRVAGAGEDGAATVALRKLDTVIGDDQPVMAKVDVEGYEDQVLAGASRLLGGASLRALEIETVSPSLADLLSAHGFQQFYYDPFSRTLGTTKRRRSANSLFVRDLPFVAGRLSTAKKIRVLSTSI